MAMVLFLLCHFCVIVKFAGDLKKGPAYPTQQPAYPTQQPAYPTQQPAYPTHQLAYPTQQATPTYTGPPQQSAAYPPLPGQPYDPQPGKSL